MGSQRVGHDWETEHTGMHACIQNDCKIKEIKYKMVISGETMTFIWEPSVLSLELFCTFKIISKPKAYLKQSSVNQNWVQVICLLSISFTRLSLFPSCAHSLMYSIYTRSFTSARDWSCRLPPEEKASLVAAGFEVPCSNASVDRDETTLRA